MEKLQPRKEGPELTLPGNPTYSQMQPSMAVLLGWKTPCLDFLHRFCTSGKKEEMQLFQLLSFHDPKVVELVCFLFFLFRIMQMGTE